MENDDMFSKKLLGLKSTLPALIVADHFNQRPDMARSYSEYQKENFLSDIGWIISFLAESVWAREPVLFEEFIFWLKTYSDLDRLNISPVNFSCNLASFSIFSDSSWV